jgi:dihydroxy-acid dehydratase
VIHKIQESIKSTEISDPCGNLATELCQKLGNEGGIFESDAIVYENEHEVIKGVRGGEVKPGNVVVIGIVV